jgi:hypothetical protein
MLMNITLESYIQAFSAQGMTTLHRQHLYFEKFFGKLVNWEATIIDVRGVEGPAPILVEVVFCIPGRAQTLLHDKEITGSIYKTSDATDRLLKLKRGDYVTITGKLGRYSSPEQVTLDEVEIP